MIYQFMLFGRYIRSSWPEDEIIASGFVLSLLRHVQAVESRGVRVEHVNIKQGQAGRFVLEFPGILMGQLSSS